VGVWFTVISFPMRVACMSLYLVGKENLPP
jgi:hypothetical protein